MNDLIALTELRLVIGKSQRRGVAVGHDSGDALFLGELSHWASIDPHPIGFEEGQADQTDMWIPIPRP